MTTDLREMSALDFIEWFRTMKSDDRLIGPRSIRTFTFAGVYDLDLIDCDTGNNALEGVRLLTKNATIRVEPALTAQDLRLLPLVGAEVFRSDRDNVAEWAAVAHLWEQGREGYPDHRLNRLEPRKVVTPILRAGRGPSYARRIINSAILHTISPLDFDFALSAEEWEMLADADIEGQAGVEGYKAAGCTLPEAARLASEHVKPGVAVACKRLGIPREQWVNYAGIPSKWVPVGLPCDEFTGRPVERPKDPFTDGPLAHGHTLDDLKAYADAGWQVSDNDWRGGKWVGRGRRGRDRFKLTPQVCRRMLAAGMDPDAVVRMADAVTASSQGYRGDADYVPSISGHYRWNDEMLPDVIRLHKAGVKPSHINDYRYCGCDSYAKVLQAVAAGIDGKRVSYLRRKHGGSGRFRRASRMTFRDLLRYHEEDPGTEPAPSRVTPDDEPQADRRPKPPRKERTTV